MWRKITEADLQTKLSGAELEGFRSAALADDQPDPVAAAITNVTGLVRGYVASHSNNTLSTETDTVPERLISSAVDILVIDVPMRAAGISLDPEDERSKAKKAAIRLLERVADGKFSIEDPVTNTESSAAVTPQYRPTRRRRFTQQTQDGI